MINSLLITFVKLCIAYQIETVISSRSVPYRYHLRLFVMIIFHCCTIFVANQNASFLEDGLLKKLYIARGIVGCVWLGCFEKATGKYQIHKAVEMLFLGILIASFFVRELCSLMDEAPSHGLGKEVLSRT